MNQISIATLPSGSDYLGYERDAVTAGIAHIGVGAFHRSHLAVYIDRCLAAGQSEWGIVGINLLPQDAALAHALRDQEGLYSLSEFAADGTRRTRVIGSLIETLYAPDDPAAVLRRLYDPAIRIVSLTITEGGYLLTPQGFRSDDPAVATDLANPEAPRGVFGLIVAALRRRRDIRAAPFAVLSCDNLRHNGDHARRAVMGYAYALDPVLALWIGENVDFPNAMVDRITPAMHAEQRAELTAQTGFDDRAPVISEDFLQFIVEDRFRHGRPDWAAHGVQMVDDVTPYEEAKLRLLNGAHQMLAFPAFLAGHRDVDVALRDSLFHDYLRRYLDDDAAPSMASLPGLDLDEYKTRVLLRFANTAIADRIDRLCMDGASKIPAFLGATLSACLREGRDARRLAFLLACYDRYVRHGADDRRQKRELREPNGAHHAQAMIVGGSPMTLLRNAEIVPPEAVGNVLFVAQYLACVDHLGRHGARETLARLGTIGEAIPMVRRCRVEVALRLG